MSDTMNCMDLRERMSAYLERELPAEERVALERHLDDCAACRHEIGLFRRTLRSLRNLPPLPPIPSWFERDLKDRIRLRGRRRTPWRVAAGLGLAASVLLSFAIGFWLGRSPAPVEQAKHPAGIHLSPDAHRDLERDGITLTRASADDRQSRTLLIADPMLYEIRPRWAGTPTRAPLDRLPGEPTMAGFQAESPEMVIEATPASAEASPPGQEVTLLPLVVKQSF